MRALEEQAPDAKVGLQGCAFDRYGLVQLPAAGFSPWLAGDPNRRRGEFVLVLHPGPVAADSGQDTRVLQLLLAELPLKTAVRLAAEITGAARNGLYEAALNLKKSPLD